MLQPEDDQSWEIVGDPDRVVPWEHPDSSAAWVWTLRRRETGQTREMVIRVSWEGFDSVDQVPSRETREAFAEKGRPGVKWFLTHSSNAWEEMIFHSQTRGGPHGSTGRHPVVRMPLE